MPKTNVSVNSVNNEYLNRNNTKATRLANYISKRLDYKRATFTTSRNLQKKQLWRVFTYTDNRTLISQNKRIGTNTVK